MVLHGDAVRDGGEHARVGGGVGARRDARVDDALDEVDEDALAVAVVAIEGGGERGRAGRFAPRVDPHAVVVLGRGGEPAGEGGERLACSITFGKSPLS